MIAMFLSDRRVFDVDCTIDIECSIDSFHAHVELEGDIQIQPGYQVLVHGEPIEVPYGERRRYERRATVTRATWVEQRWTRLTAHFELTELYDLSFSGMRDL